MHWLKHIICHLSVFAGQWLDLKASHFNSGACQGYCRESGIFLWRADGISHGWLRTILVSKIFNFSKAVFVDGFTFNAFILRWWKEKRHFLTVTCKWPIIDVIKLPNFAQLLLHFFLWVKPTDRKSPCQRCCLLFPWCNNTPASKHISIHKAMEFLHAI